jgi:outer membrane protein TolC
MGGLLTLNLPFERTKERNMYRNTLIQLESTVRAYQAAEDELKQSVRKTIRDLRERREQLIIQFGAVSLAERRVRNNDLLLQAGRSEMRDVLDAQAALLSAQNSLYSAIRGYRVNELQLLKELGVLDVAVEGAWNAPDLSELALWADAQP